MESFIIEGGHRLTGEVVPSGNKNAALPMLSACLLTDEPIVLHNVPQIGDVKTMFKLIDSLGVDLEDLGGNSWRIHARDIRVQKLNPDLCRKIRASILLAGPILARECRLELPPPGGDIIGRRRLDTHILALTALGAEVRYDPHAKLLNFTCSGMRGADLFLDEASVTATENAIMAAVLARGHTVIRNAASEPHIQELCHFLNHLGAQIENIGSNLLHITGVERLHGGEFTIGPDYLEIISYVTAAVVTRGTLTIRSAGVQHLDMIRLVFSRLGIHWDVQGDDILVPADQQLVIHPDLGNAIPEISVMPWPAFPTDLMSIAIVAATQCRGSILFHDWMYPSRMYFTDKLVGMGAQIVLCDPHRCIVNGPSTLYGETLDSPDIRAGMALVLAALAAEGRSTIRNVVQIDRGYAEVEKKLSAAGAVIQRV